MFNLALKRLCNLVLFVYLFFFFFYYEEFSDWSICSKNFFFSLGEPKFLLLLSLGYYFSRLTGFSKEDGEILKLYVVRRSCIPTLTSFWSLMVDTGGMVFLQPASGNKVAQSCCTQVIYETVLKAGVMERWYFTQSLLCTKFLF